MIEHLILLPYAAREQYFNDLLIDELQSTNEIENVFSTKQEIAHALNNKHQTFLSSGASWINIKR